MRVEKILMWQGQQLHYLPVSKVRRNGYKTNCVYVTGCILYTEVFSTNSGKEDLRI